MTSPKIPQIYQFCYEQLVSGGFFCSSLVDRLFTQQCITVEEKEWVNCLQTPSEKSRYLLDILSQKSVRVFDVVLAFLRQEKSKAPLWKILRSAVEEFGYESLSDDDGPTRAKQGRVGVLLQKWWPEHKELITSFVPRSDEEGGLLVHHLRQQLLSTERKVAAIVAKKHAIVGMGGIGKTSTAKWYANAYEAEYDHILWMDSEGDSLLNSFDALGKRLKLKRDEFGSTVEFVMHIYEKLACARSLFIFDNAERFERLCKLLPRQEAHHALITSRNHEWGLPNEFGRISTFELGVFTDKECVELLTKALGAEGKAGTMAEQLALGEELGFLPLALQCAAATILRSKQYTVASYTKTIHKDLLVLMDKKKILTEYERTISATLRLSVEQIERDEDIEEDVREYCLIILNVAAYCEPNDISETLFFGLPNAREETLRTAVDQLLVYSLVSFEKFADLFRYFGIHRLLQHVIRHKVLVDSERAIRAIHLAFECMRVNLIELQRHAICAWDTASEQFDEILRTCHSFPFEVAQVLPSDSVSFIRRSISHLRRVFAEWELPIIQLQLVRIQKLLFDQVDRDLEEAEEVYTSLINMLGDESRIDTPFRAELTLHLRIIGLDIQKCLVEEENVEKDLSTRYATFLEAQLKLLQELTSSGYDGKIGDTHLYFPTKVGEEGLSLRMVLSLRYVLGLCLAQQFPTAIDFIRTELEDWSLVARQMDLSYINAIRHFLVQAKCSLPPVQLRAVMSELYQQLRLSLQEQSLTEQDCKRSETVSDFLKSYALWLQKDKQPLNEVVGVFSDICQMRWTPGQTPSLVNGMLRLFKNQMLLPVQLNVSSVDWQALLNIFRVGWKNLTTIIKSPIETSGLRGHEIKAECCGKLLELNAAVSHVLLLDGQLIDKILATDVITTKLLNGSAIDWARFHKKRSAQTADHLSLPIISLMSINEVDRTRMLESKALLMGSVIKLTLEDKDCLDLTSISSVMQTFDVACLIQLCLGRFEQAKELWSISMELILGPNAVGPCSLSLVMRIGQQTLGWLERQAEDERAAQTMRTFMGDIEKCAQTPLQQQIGMCSNYKSKNLLRILLRLVSSGFVETAAKLLARVMYEMDEKFRHLQEILVLERLSKILSGINRDDPEALQLVVGKLKEAYEQITREPAHQSDSEEQLWN